jgi:SAM-dependent methyltransferase
VPPLAILPRMSKFPRRQDSPRDKPERPSPHRAPGAREEGERGQHGAARKGGGEAGRRGPRDGGGWVERHESRPPAPGERRFGGRARPAPEGSESPRPRGRGEIVHGGGQRPPIAAQPPGEAVRSRHAGAGRPPAAATAWEGQADWYDRHQGQDGDDFYRDLILPAVLRQLQVVRGRRVLDICCGQGVLGRALAEAGVATMGVDASPALVAAARKRAGPLEQHAVADARDLPAALDGVVFDGAAVVLALQDLDPIEPVLAGAAQALRPGARLVVVLTHPCFRIPKRTGWGWDDRDGIQYRRVEAYLSPLALPIKTHPGMAADPSRTTSFHRPLSTYLTAIGQAGMAVVGCEELCSGRRGTRGVRWAAEDRAAKEIPLFLVLTAVRR